MMKLLATILLFCLLVVSGGQAADTMQAFPPAEEGMVRYVIHLPKQDDESAFKVELIVGKMVQVDEQNRYFFAGKIEAETITGWGFTRYTVKTLGSMAGTLMAVDPMTPKVTRFVTLGDNPYIIPFNSRLPIVIYLPAGVTVRYRLWTAGAEVRGVEQG